MGTKTDFKLTAFRCLKPPVLWPRSDKAHEELRYLINPSASRSTFRHS